MGTSEQFRAFVIKSKVLCNRLNCGEKVSRLGLARGLRRLRFGVRLGLLIAVIAIACAAFSQLPVYVLLHLAAVRGHLDEDGLVHARKVRFIPAVALEHLSR